MLPRSWDLIVALYAGDGFHSSGGLMAIRVTGPSWTGQYTAKIVGFYQYPNVPDINPPNPSRPGNLGIAIKTVETDPTGVLGDERFAVVADIWHADDDGNPKTVPPALDPGVTQEFSYNSTTGEIKPVSAPFLASATRGVHGGIYDYQGNLWTTGMLVYAGGPHCPFDINQWNAHPESYTSTAGGKTVWGQTCAPDYDVLQQKDVGGGGLFGNFLQIAEDPVSHTIVGVDTWDTGNVIAVRHAGSGRNKTFTIGNLVDTGRNLLPRQGPPEQRPPAIDKSGRLWFTVHIWPPAEGHTQPLNHWVTSVDIASLFTPAPVPLATAGPTRVQAERTTTTATVQRAPAPDGVIVVDSAAYMQRCTWPCSDDGVPGDGYQMRGTAEYQVFAPTAGTYAISYQVRGDGTVNLSLGGTTYPTTVSTGGAWRPVTGPVVTLSAGVNTLRVSGGGWQLNWLTLTAPLAARASAPRRAQLSCQLGQSCVCGLRCGCGETVSGPL